VTYDDLLDDGDFLLCSECNFGLSVDDKGEWFCERCDPTTPSPEPTSGVREEKR
jgi:hypothetical protein